MLNSFDLLSCCLSCRLHRAHIHVQVCVCVCEMCGERAVILQQDCTPTIMPRVKSRKKKKRKKIYIYHVQTLNAGRLLHILYNMRRVRLLHATCIFISQMTNEEQQFKVWRKRVVLL